MKTDILNVSLLQLDLSWENVPINREKCEHYFKQLPENCDLVVLPEMFTSGFTMNPENVAETMDGETMQWLKKWSAELNVAICGSLVVSENELFYNRFVFVKPSRSVAWYDKRHTFNMAGEGEKYEAGTKQVVIKYKSWSIFPQVCYDLRFPVFARNTLAYDLVIYVANWPKTRVAAWDILLQARAIENMSYSIGVNRVGIDGNNLEYTGHSAVYNALGSELIKSELKEGILSTSLSKEHLQETRKKLPFLEDKDRFTLL